MTSANTQSEKDDYIQDRLEHAHALIEKLEAGDAEEADQVINELSKMRDNDLFQDVGRLTRELHEKINGFGADDHLQHIMTDDMPDARERLNFVIKSTEESAHNTLTAVEHGMPIVDGMSKRAMTIKQEWQEFLKHPSDVAAFRNLAAELDDYLQQVVDDAKTVHGDMTSILMAQGYQDTTGQIIQRVIKLVQGVEQSLVGLIRVTGKHSCAVKTAEKPVEKDNKGYGPAIPGVTKGEVMNNQDDVDSLLSELGF